MTLKLMSLPYAHDALEPAMSAETLKTHHGKHHAKYVNTVNELIKGTKYEDMALDELVRSSHDDGDRKLFNNAAQVWNHDLFWHSMTSVFADPPKALADAIGASFGSMSAFIDQFVAKGEAHFGSGWVWLLANGTKLAIEDTHDADNPLVHGKTPILVCDVWEHAYYLDTKNDRKAFLTSFINKLVNWEHAATLFAGAGPQNLNAAA
ncbi:MAG: superoxide dismutase [Alphaproteobacteria bacterium]|nr:superoxide dismutase [Alphaproteobacteria bacterium]